MDHWSNTFPINSLYVILDFGNLNRRYELTIDIFRNAVLFRDTFLWEYIVWILSSWALCKGRFLKITDGRSDLHDIKRYLPSSCNLLYKTTIVVICDKECFSTASSVSQPSEGVNLFSTDFFLSLLKFTNSRKVLVFTIIHWAYIVMVGFFR